MASRQRSKVSVPEDAPYAVNFIFSVKVGWHVPDQASATSLEGRGSVGDHRTSHRESSVHTTSIASGSGACHPSYALLCAALWRTDVSFWQRQRCEALSKKL
jgi:hypothetical protein